MRPRWGVALIVALALVSQPVSASAEPIEFSADHHRTVTNYGYYLGMDSPRFVKTSVSVHHFLLGIGGKLSNPSGGCKLGLSDALAEQSRAVADGFTLNVKPEGNALAAVAKYYCLTAEQSMRVSTTLLVFLVGIDATTKGQTIEDRSVAKPITSSPVVAAPTGVDAFADPFVYVRPDLSPTVLADAAIIASIRLGGAPTSLLQAFGKVFVSVSFADSTQVLRIYDPATAVRLAEFPLGRGSQPPVAIGESILVQHKAGVLMIDPATLVAYSLDAFDGFIDGSVTAGDSVWVTISSHNIVATLDGELDASDIVPVGNAARTPTYAHGLLWVSNFSDHTVTVIDPIQKAVVATIPVGESPLQPYAVDSTIFVPATYGRNVTMIDAATLAVVGTIDLPAQPHAPVIFDGKLWITTKQPTGAHAGEDAGLSIDGDTREVTRFAVPLDVGNAPPIVAGGHVWLPSQYALRKLNTDTGQAGPSILSLLGGYSVSLVALDDVIVVASSRNSYLVESAGDLTFYDTSRLPD